MSALYVCSRLLYFHVEPVTGAGKAAGITICIPHGHNVFLNISTIHRTSFSLYTCSEDLIFKTFPVTKFTCLMWSLKHSHNFCLHAQADANILLLIYANKNFIKHNRHDDVFIMEGLSIFLFWNGALKLHDWVFQNSFSMYLKKWGWDVAQWNYWDTLKTC